MIVYIIVAVKWSHILLSLRGNDIADKRLLIILWRHMAKDNYCHTDAVETPYTSIKQSMAR